MGILLGTYDPLFGICTLPPYIPSLGNMYFMGLITLLMSNQSIDQFYR